MYEEIFKGYEDEQEFIALLRKLDGIKESTKTLTTMFIDTKIPPFDIFREMIEKQAQKNQK